MVSRGTHRHITLIRPIDERMEQIRREQAQWAVEDAIKKAIAENDVVGLNALVPATAEPKSDPPEYAFISFPIHTTISVEMMDALIARWVFTPDEYHQWLMDALVVKRSDLAEWAFSKGGRIQPDALKGIEMIGIRPWMHRVVAFVRTHQPDFDWAPIRARCASVRSEIDAFEATLP